MTLGRGHVVRGAAAAEPIPLDLPKKAEGAVRVPRAQVSAHEQARAILLASERRARAILEHAERGAADARLRAEELGRARGLAEVSAWSLRLRARESDADRASLERSVEFAKLLAERLLGRALELEPSLVSNLAREAFAEVRAARRVKLFAHPSDAATLEASVSVFDPDGQLHEIVRDPALGRGDLRLETELGAVDAKLGAELERLAGRLREALES